MESDSLNTISWVSSSTRGRGNVPFFFFFFFYINEIKFLSSSMDVELRHMLCRSNEEADLLA